MIKKTLIILICFALVGVITFAAASCTSPTVSAPQRITADSACPVVGCANGTCHGYDNVPEPDGITEMSCPEASCTSTECHAWEALRGHYRTASDASLNLWILFPILLVAGLVAFVRRAK